MTISAIVLMAPMNLVLLTLDYFSIFKAMCRKFACVLCPVVNVFLLGLRIVIVDVMVSISGIQVVIVDFFFLGFNWMCRWIEKF